MPFARPLRLSRDFISVLQHFQRAISGLYARLRARPDLDDNLFST
jgi:hypothetical protein